MSKIFVLVDFENVQPASIALLAHEQYRLLVFVGATQSKLPTEVVIGMQAMGTRAEYVRISGSGKNALDFHIAYYLGKLAAAHPDAAFHVISRDTGFDPLVAFMREQGIPVDRLGSLDALSPDRTAGDSRKPAPAAKTAVAASKPGKTRAFTVIVDPPSSGGAAKPSGGTPKAAARNAAATATAKSKASRADEYLAVYGKPNAPRPKTEKTLASSIRNHLGKNLPATEVAAVIKALVARGFLTIAGGRVSYKP